MLVLFKYDYKIFFFFYSQHDVLTQVDALTFIPTI